MTLLILSILLFSLAAISAALFMVNLRLFRRLPPMPSITDTAPAVSVLIPARNEEVGIAACVESVLSSRGVDLDVVVLDDNSQDRTGSIVRQVADRDPRVRLASAPPLPEGWCGKQHACFSLAQLARHDRMLFIDADVRLKPDAVARAVCFLEQSRAELVSGFPRQETGSILEKLLMPLIHFILLSFLPIWRMRSTTHPAYAAGCGQFLLVRRPAYQSVGGHAAIRQSMHDGITLPREFRRAGFKTDLFDATDCTTCRMYRNSHTTWQGLAKNATEGMASLQAIVPWTILLLGGQVLPVAVLLGLLINGSGGGVMGDIAMLMSVSLCAAAVAVSYTVRIIAAVRFRQSWLGVLLHPLSIVTLLAIQWYALARTISGYPVTWKGRAYTGDRGSPMPQPGVP